MEYSKYKLQDPEVNKILTGIRVADCMLLGNTDDCDNNSDDKITARLHDITISNVLTCSYCNISFNDATDQRNHYKLDWHRYNLKRALCDKQPVTEDVFNGLADDVSSISGSDSESSNKDDSDAEINDVCDKNDIDKGDKKFSRGRHAKAFFENSSNKILSVYKCLLHSKKDAVSNSSLIHSLNELIESPRKWLVIMIGGGHFAAAIYNNGIIAEHKTFHCYTVRAKQGGMQSSRDNRGGGHPKSAGASLRRYNEQALVQHVREIITSWADSVKQCQLILYRATGRYNRGVLFGGKNPPLEKTDSRLRNIPFPTRRPTYKEVQRVYDILCTVEVYGISDDFKDNYPRSPEKRFSPRKTKLTTNEPGEIEQCQNLQGNVVVNKKKKTARKIDRSKPRCSPDRELPGENIKSDVDDVSSDEDDVLITDYMTVELEELQEYDDTVPQSMKEGGNTGNKAGAGVPRQRRKKVQKSAFERRFEALQKKLVMCCEKEDKDLLVNTLGIYESLPDTSQADLQPEGGASFTKKDFIECLNSRLNNENKNTILHVAASQCLSDFIPLLLEAGADPSVKNKNRLTPYVISGNKETRNSFKEFANLHPDKFDYKMANIPGPLSEEMQKLSDEKKREKNKMKRQKLKMKKKEFKEKREEEKEKERFLALSDREKCALAAERRMLAAATSNLKSSKPPVLSRCFLCGIDITGKVPFEYGTNRFCSIPCVKAHRHKTNSYVLEI